FESSHDEARMSDARVASLRSRVQLVADQALAEAHPPRQAIVHVTTLDGRTVSTRVRAVRGTADNPMSRQEVVAKAQDLIAPVVGVERGRELIAAVLDLEAVSDMGRLTPLLRTS